MGKVNATWIAGALLSLAIPMSAAPGCGDATAPSPVQNQAGSAATGGTTGSAGSGGAGIAGAAGSSGDTTLTDTYEPGCALCARAEACCKAEGLTDCNYASLCAKASNAEKAGFYMALCRKVLDAASSGNRTLPDVCGT
jgi:hypothetical protein